MNISIEYLNKITPKNNNIVIFVKGAIPGEKVKAKIYKKKKKYLEAYVVEKIKQTKNQHQAKIITTSSQHTNNIKQKSNTTLSARWSITAQF